MSTEDEIKIGIFLNTNYGPDEDVAACFRESLEQVRAARDYGFASVCIGQHARGSFC